VLAAYAKLLSLDGLPRNARNAVMLEPLWAIFGVVILYYAPLYMTGIGLSSTQVGLIGSISLACSFVFQTLAAPITNRMGRKRTTLIWDLISWTLPMLVWAFSQNFAMFVLGAVLNASVRIVSVSWSLLVIEDVEPAERSRVFGILNLLVAACGLMTPVVGLLISRYGVVPTLRVYHFLGALGMTLMFVLRNAATEETRNGQAAMQEHAQLHPLESLGKNLHQLATLRQTPGLMWLVAFYVLSFFIEQMNLFQILFFSQTLGFGDVGVSLVPVATAAVTVLMYGLVLRQLSSLPPERALLLTCVLGLVGAILIVLIPAGNLPVLLGVIAVISGSAFLTRTYRDSVLFIQLPEQGAADLYSAVQALTMLFSIPAAAIAGAIFSAQPVALFVLIAVLNLGLVALAWVVAKGQQARTKLEPEV
jgi:MFS family permease